MLKFECIRANNVYLVGDEQLVSNKIIHVNYLDDEEIFVKDTNIKGIYTYGCKTLTSDYFGHPPGYIWSSRASVMNKQFNLSLVDVYYKNMGSTSYCICAIDVDYLCELIRETGKTSHVSITYTDEDTKYIVEAI